RLGTLSMAAFVLAGAMSGLVGAVTVPQTSVVWNNGLTFGLTGFIAAALAGFTNPIGAVVAGLGLGVVEGVAGVTAWANYGRAIVFGVLIVYLFAKDLVGEDGVLRRLVKRLVQGRSARAASRRAEPLTPPAAPASAAPVLDAEADAAPAPAATASGGLRLPASATRLLPLAALALAALSPLFLTAP